jgi:uncharacterized membrane protein YwzB
VWSVGVFSISGPEEITMPSLKGMNVEALMKLRNQVDERLLTVAIAVGVAIALAIIGYLLHWISA